MDTMDTIDTGETVDASDTPEAYRIRDGGQEHVQALAPVSKPASGDQGDDGYAHDNHTWRQELPRWLASLNPGRTRREYEKAIGYFFATPGVPAVLAELSFDLLLAYRGALALRATSERDRRGMARSRASAGTSGSSALLQEAAQPVLEGHAPAPEGDGAPAAPSQQGPLAPATVNIRLTALRQFLSYGAMAGSLPQLTPDRIRAALRRLSIERRRPYQVLAEPEWEQFLAAARAPLEQPASPWGTPRAARMPAGQLPTRLTRSRAGLTGAKTAQRDHALIALALATGLRAVELSELDVGDLRREFHAGHEEWWLVLPDAKTKGQRGGRTLPIAPGLLETLRAYLADTGRAWERTADRQTPLFLSAGRRRAYATANTAGEENQDGSPPEPRAYRRLSPNDIGRIVDRVESQWLAMQGDEPGGVEKRTRGESRVISPHALRHSTAVALLEGNDEAGRPPASVEHVRGWLGHFDIRTTQGYLAHLEARRHRRPFALSPITSNPPPSHTPIGEAAPDAAEPDAAEPDAAEPVAGMEGPGGQNGEDDYAVDA
jgi:integrase